MFVVRVLGRFLKEMAEVVDVNMNMDVMKIKFYKRLDEIVAKKNGNNSFLSQEKYKSTIDLINDLKSGRRKKEVEDYQLLKWYDVVRIGNINKLIYPVAEGNNSIRYYATNDDFFSIIHEAHLSTGHGGRNRIQNEVQIKYKNVTAEYIMIYLRLYVSCLKKGQVPQKCHGIQRNEVKLTSLTCKVKQTWITNGSLSAKIT